MACKVNVMNCLLQDGFAAPEDECLNDEDEEY